MVLFWFLVNINDIVNFIDSNNRLFAEDTSLYIIVDSPVHAARQFNQDHEKIKKGQVFATRTEPMLFSRQVKVSLDFDNCGIAFIKTNKHLDDARWSTHIQQL